MFASVAKNAPTGTLFACDANYFRNLLAFSFSACENASTRSSLSTNLHQIQGLNVNTITQQQMTIGRNAFGLSLLASQLPASLKNTGAALEQRACGGHRHQPNAASFCGYRWEHAHHIRGGNPWSLRITP
jgi:hypothetical protein